jgi:hypothetical protein
MFDTPIFSYDTWLQDEEKGVGRPHEEEDYE